jgi:hypothetical protein
MLPPPRKKNGILTPLKKSIILNWSVQTGHPGACCDLMVNPRSPIPVIAPIDILFLLRLHSNVGLTAPPPGARQCARILHLRPRRALFLKKLLCSKRGRKTHESIPSAKRITIYIHDERKYLQISITFYARFFLYANQRGAHPRKKCSLARDTCLVGQTDVGIPNK